MNIEEIVRIDQRIMLMEEAKRKMVNQFVAEHHPHQVGSKVDCNDLLHACKTMRVTQSYMDLHRAHGGLIYAYSFHSKGRIITKTDKAGARVGEWVGHSVPVKSLENGIAQTDHGK